MRRLKDLIGELSSICHGVESVSTCPVFTYLFTYLLIYLFHNCCKVFIAKSSTSWLRSPRYHKSLIFLLFRSIGEC